MEVRTKKRRRKTALCPRSPITFVASIVIIDDCDNPNEMIILLNWSGPDKARKFAASDDLLETI